MEKETYSRYEKFIVEPTIEKCKAFYYAEKLLEDPTKIEADRNLCFTIIRRGMPYLAEIFFSSDELQTLPSLKIVKKVSKDSSGLLIINVILHKEGEIYLSKLVTDRIQRHRDTIRDNFYEFVDELWQDSLK